MITSTTIERREQTPDEGYNWLYRSTYREVDGVQEEIRSFAKKVSLGIYDTPYEQCTQAEYDAWQEAHKEPDPTDTVEQRAVRYIRERYSINQEFHIARISRKANPTEEELTKIATYDDYAESCVKRAKKELGEE